LEAEINNGCTAVSVGIAAKKVALQISEPAPCTAPFVDWVRY